LIARDDLFKLPTSDVALLFASLSRFFSLNDNLDPARFQKFKLMFTDKLVGEEELSVQDVLALIIPLAAEEITRDEVWDKFADIIISNEHKIVSDRFQSCSNLAWAFAKTNYQGKHSKLFWSMIERVYKEELDQLRSNMYQPVHHSATVLSSITMALKYQTKGMSD